MENAKALDQKERAADVISGPKILNAFGMKMPALDVRPRHRVPGEATKTEKQKERFRHCSPRSRHY
jgi:hypothetical protein